jgi:hypothetical protein
MSPPTDITRRAANRHLLRPPPIRYESESPMGERFPQAWVLRTLNGPGDRNRWAALGTYTVLADSPARTVNGTR